MAKIINLKEVIDNINIEEEKERFYKIAEETTRKLKELKKEIEIVKKSSALVREKTEALMQILEEIKALEENRDKEYKRTKLRINKKIDSKKK